MSIHCCPFYTCCDKLKFWEKKSHENLQSFKAEREKNEREIREYQSLFSLNSAGVQIVGIDKAKNGGTFVVFCKETDNTRSQYFYLVQLPIPESMRWHEAGRLDLRYVAGGGARIVDWYTTVHNCGHGSILMKQLLNFLQAAGYHYVYGSISSVDYDHLDLLLHFYRKFGFQITDNKYGGKNIYLDLDRAKPEVDLDTLRCMAKVKEIAEQKGISSEKIAQRLMISQQLYAKYEQGLAPLSIKDLKEISELLGVSLDYVVEPPENYGVSRPNQKI